MDTEDFNKIADEFGETTPKNKKPDLKEEKPRPHYVNLKKPKHPIPTTQIRIKGAFGLGIKFAIGFWLVTLVILGVLYIVIQLGYLVL